MSAFMGTLVVVFAAITAWWWLATTYFKFSVEPSARQIVPIQTPEPAQIIMPDLKHIPDIISASHHNMPLIVVGATAIAIVAILAKALVRVVEINAQRPHYEQPQGQLEGPREAHRGNLPAVRRD